MNKLTKAFIKEYVEHQEWKKKQKSKYIDMNSWFKESGEIEEDKPVYQFKSQRSSRFVYDENARCHTLHEIRNAKIYKENENINKNE